MTKEFLLVLVVKELVGKRVFVIVGGKSWVAKELDGKRVSIIVGGKRVLFTMGGK